MFNKLNRKTKILIGVAAFVILGLVIFLNQNNTELYRTFQSPDGRYALEVYAIPRGSYIPGQSGDRPGYVVLKNSEGKVLKKVELEMVQLVDDPIWEPNFVRQRLVFEWALSN